MAITGLESALGSTGGVNLNQLFGMYQQQVQGVDSDTATKAAQVRGTDFAQQLGNSLVQLDNLDKTAQDKAIQAATGDLTDVQDYVIASTKAQTATELTTTIRNKALDSFNEIMRMPL
jgi:flagellar hook-basal body complex protein FliE